MLRPILAAAVTTVALFGAGAAHAGTHWSIGINLPLPVVVDSPRYYVQQPAPVYYAPPPVVYAPAPRYVQRDVYYAPQPRVFYETAYRERRWEDRDDRWHDRRHEHGRWDNGHDRDDRDYGPRRGR